MNDPNQMILCQLAVITAIANREPLSGSPGGCHLYCETNVFSFRNEAMGNHKHLEQLYYLTRMN